MASTSTSDAERQLCDALGEEKVPVTAWHDILSCVSVRLLNEHLSKISGSLLESGESTVFAGFDAVAMRKTIMEKAKPGQIVLCIIVGLVWGNDAPGILSTMKGTMIKRDFAEAVKILDIKPRVSGKRSVITLSRIIACYPEVASYTVSLEQFPMAVPYTSLTSIHTEFPLCARHQACASLIPDTLVEGELYQALDVILVPYLMMSEIINSRNKCWCQKTKLERAQLSAGYLRNYYNSRVLSAEERLDQSKNMGIVSGSGKLSSTWISVATQATAWLKKSYSFSFTDEE